MAARKKPVTSDVSVPVDANLKRLWDKHSKVISAARQRDASAFDERWEAAAAIVEHEPPLFVVGGHKNAAEFFRHALDEAPRTAFRNIRVAKYASPKQELALGIHRIDAALSFLEAKLGRPLGKSLPTALEKVRIPIPARGKDGSAILAEATVAQISAATKRLLKESGRTRKRAQSTAKVALEAALSKTKTLAAIEVRESGGFVTLSRIPVSAWTSFVTALRSAKVSLPT